MRYSYEFKRKAVDLYRQGCWPDTPKGIKDVNRFRRMVREWVRIEDACGPEAFRHRNQNKEYSLYSKLIISAS